jgi:hypothetical protein
MKRHSIVRQKAVLKHAQSNASRGSVRPRQRGAF